MGNLTWECEGFQRNSLRELAEAMIMHIVGDAYYSEFDNDFKDYFPLDIDVIEIIDEDMNSRELSPARTLIVQNYINRKVDEALKIISDSK